MDLRFPQISMRLTCPTCSKDGMEMVKMMTKCEFSQIFSYHRSQNYCFPAPTFIIRYAHKSIDLRAYFTELVSCWGVGDVIFKGHT